MHFNARFKYRPKYCRIVVACLALCLGATCARAENFKTIFEKRAETIRWDLKGGSFIENGKAKERVELPAAATAKGLELHAFLLWSGEGKRLNDKVRSVTLTDGTKTQEIASDVFMTEKSEGYSYTAVADVTEILKKSPGKFFLSLPSVDSSGTAADGQPLYSGWALLTLHVSANPGKRMIRFLAGAESVRPGEPLNISLASGKGLSRLVRLGIVGGHGIAGNGGANLLNGISITGKDDWTGSSGELWDVRVHSINQKEKNAWVLTVDPLLEWIFPVCVVAEFNH